MIKRAERENIDEIKRLWKVCFPDVDERYQEAVGPAEPVEPWCADQRRSASVHQEPQADAAGKRSDRPLHRMWFL